MIIAHSLFFTLVILGVWETVWKAVAAWHAARNRHLGWFVMFFVFNTAGILPIIYLGWFDKKNSVSKKVRKKR